MKNYYETDFPAQKMVVKEGSTLELGKHTLTFIGAAMVHWPEVLMSYESTEKVLFTADAFGKFGALDVEEDWACEARRYYIGIRGQVRRTGADGPQEAAAWIFRRSVPSRTGPYGKSGILYQPVQYLVQLRCGERRCNDRIFLCVRQHEEGGGVSRGRAEGQGLSEGRCVRPGS